MVMGRTTFSFFVIAGLDPAIHLSSRKMMDARVKPAHDGLERRRR
jgi:hypothetical protein